MASSIKPRRVSLPPGKKKKLILVVEDDETLRALIVRALSPLYDTIQAADGLVASELLGGPRVPDLVLCDVMMPKVDGFTLAKMMRGRRELAKVPLIFLTAKTNPASVVQGIQLGAKHYLQKPFSVKDLVDKVNKVLQ